jgi:hypothetical protein
MTMRVGTDTISKRTKLEEVKPQSYNLSWNASFHGDSSATNTERRILIASMTLAFRDEKLE